MSKKELMKVLKNLKVLRNKYYKFLNESSDELSILFYKKQINDLTEKIVDIYDCIKTI